MIKDICYATDEDYVKLAAASIVSFVENHRGTDELVFHIFCFDVKEISKNRLSEMGANLKIRIKIYDVDMLKLMSKKKDYRNFSLAAYGRIFIGDIISEEVEEILYLDCDTFVVGDLTEFLGTKPGDGKCILGAEDYGAMVKERLTRFGLEPPLHYINSGVMIMDLHQWRRLELRKKLMSEYESLPADPPYFDQDLINVFAQDYIDATMDKAYNSIKLIAPSQFNQAYFEENGFKIIHYGGATWKLQAEDFRRLFLEYYKKTPWKNTRLISPFSVMRTKLRTKTVGWLHEDCKPLYRLAQKSYALLRRIDKRVNHS